MDNCLAPSRRFSLLSFSVPRVVQGTQPRARPSPLASGEVLFFQFAAFHFRFDTTVPGLTFSDQYLSVTTRLPSAYVYGLGEHNQFQFAHDMNWRTWTIFARDAGVSAVSASVHSAFFQNTELKQRTFWLGKFAVWSTVQNTSDESFWKPCGCVSGEGCL